MGILDRQGLYFVDVSLVEEGSLADEELQAILPSQVSSLEIPTTTDTKYIIDIKDYLGEDSIFSLHNYIKEAQCTDITIVVLVETFSNHLKTLDAQKHLYSLLRESSPMIRNIFDFTLKPASGVEIGSVMSNRNTRVLVFGDNKIGLEDDYEVIKTVYGRSLVTVVEGTETSIIEHTIDSICTDNVSTLILIHTGSTSINYESLTHIVTKQDVISHLIELIDDSVDRPSESPLISKIVNRYQVVHLGNGTRNEARLIRLLATNRASGID